MGPLIRLDSQGTDRDRKRHRESRAFLGHRLVSARHTAPTPLHGTPGCLETAGAPRPRGGTSSGRSGPGSSGLVPSRSGSVPT